MLEVLQGSLIHLNPPLSLKGERGVFEVNEVKDPSARLNKTIHFS